MKRLSKFITATSILFVTVGAYAQRTSSQRVNLEKDFDTLGGNDILIKKAQALDPDNKIRIVQKRLVDRNLRFEITANFGGLSGGDSYVDSTLAGGNIEFHFTPHWSFGIRHQIFGNKLSAEGDRVYSESQKAVDVPFRQVEIDYPVNTTLALISWYPIYGKANIFDAGISQFDVYLMAGGGQMNLSSGSTSTVAAGGGVGFWLTQHFSLRAELRGQNYKDRLNDVNGPRNNNVMIGQLGIGLLL